MGASCVRGDGEAEPRPGAVVLVAGGVEPGKGLDGLLAHLRWDAGAVILDADAQEFLCKAHRDLGAVGVAQGVADEILDSAPDCGLAQLDRAALPLLFDERHVAPHALGALRHLACERKGINRGGLVHPGTAGEVEELVDQPLHLFDIAEKILAVLRVEQGEAELEPGERGAHVVADLGEDQRALLDVPLDAGAHLQKGIAGDADLDRPRGAVLDVAALAERLGRGGKPGDRAQLVPLVEKGDDRHQQSHENHGDGKLVRVVGRHPVAVEFERDWTRAGLEMQDDVISGQIDRVQAGLRIRRGGRIRAAGGEALEELPRHIGPGYVIPAAQTVLGRRLPRRRGLDGNRERAHSARGGRGLALENVADLAAHRARHLHGGPLNVPAHEGDRHHRSHRHHRQQQDEHGPREQAARHAGFEPGADHAIRLEGCRAARKAFAAIRAGGRERRIMGKRQADGASSVIEEMGDGIRRIVAPNPSPMTLHGTNTYLIGEREVAVIDPGPDIPSHLAAILAALGPGQRVSHIFVTHSHTDHSALAPALAQETGAATCAYGPWGSGLSETMQSLAADGLEGGEGADRAFVPDLALADGETVATNEWNLTAHWTPGHLGNHMCFAQGDVVFVGDLVMGWASSMVSPPDGDLTDFMASCRKLRALGARTLHSGHGDPVADPTGRIDWLIAHRLEREAQIVEWLGHGPATARELAEAIYTDTPPALLPAAERNVLAHLIDLHGRGLAEAQGPVAAGAVFRVV